MRTTTLLAALVLLLSGSADAIELSTTGVTFGSTFPTSPKIVTVQSSKPYTITRTGDWCWHPGLTVQPLGGVGPQAVAIFVDKRLARANEVDHTLLAFTDADGTVVLDVRISCSGSSGCGQPEGNPSGSRPTCGSEPLPTNARTATPLPGVTPRPTQTAQPNQPTRTAVPAQPTAIRTAVPVPTAAPPINPAGYVQPPVRPIPWEHLTLQLNDQSRYYWCMVPVNGDVQSLAWQRVPCTQKGRVQMVLSSVMATVEVMREASLRGFSQSVVDRWVDRSSGLGHIFGDLLTIYIMDALDVGVNGAGASGDWVSKKTGGFYQIEKYALNGFRNNFMRSEHRSRCLALPLTMKNLLNIDATCTRAAPPLLPAITMKSDDRYEQMGAIQADRAMPPPTARELALLDEATDIHHCASLRKCNQACPERGFDGQPRSTRNVQQVLLELEQECAKRGEEYAHFCTVPQFSAGTDPRLSPADQCLIAMQGEDFTWNKAVEAFKNVSLGRARWPIWWLWWSAHMETHAMMGLKTEGQKVEMLYRLPCFNAAGDLLDIHDCPLESESEVRARWRREAPQYAGALADTQRVARATTEHDACSGLAADPQPTPTRTRRDTRPTATPNPAHPVVSLDSVVGPVTLPAKLTITCRRLDPTSGVNRLRVWLRTPTQGTTPKTPAYCAKMCRFGRDRHEDTITCRLNDRAPEGTWQLCGYVPDEPGAPYAGLDVGCQTVEVRR